MDVVDRLEVEFDAFDDTLATLDERGWSHPSLCEGWDARDVVCHLWLQAEAAIDRLAGRTGFLGDDVVDPSTLDAQIDAAVRARRDLDGPEVWRRWRESRSEVTARLREAPPDLRVLWTVSEMSARTLATTLMMEAWTHGYDVRAPMGLEQPSTPGLRDVVWFVWRTLPYAFAANGLTYEPVRFEVRDAAGQWSIGPDDTGQVVRGDAVELALRGVRRMELDEATTLQADGDVGQAALRVMKAFP